MTVIVESLVKQGVHRFCLSPGSRSTPLAVAIAAHKEVSPFVHFDERGMAFHALGYAKASHTSVALISTSGTAVGNLFPAIMEASLSCISLIVLTADRPPELQDCGANQTLDQIKIFGNFVRWHFNLPPDASEPFIRSTMIQAFTRSANGPVHINCMFREPFV